MKARLYAICKKTGGVATDTFFDGETTRKTDVFYASTNASDLSEHARTDKGERILLLPPTAQKRAWALRVIDSGKLLEVAAGVIMAAGRKRTAKFIASLCKFPVVPVALG